MNSLIFIDTETTGLDPNVHEIIEIAIVIITPSKGKLIYEFKIKPQRLIMANQKALEINGYNDLAWQDTKPFKHHAEYIAHLLSDGIIIGHNVDFDYQFIKAELRRANCKTRISYKRIDTQMLAREHLPLVKVSLDQCRLFFGWKLEGHHRALKDALDAKKLYYKLNRATIIHRLFWRIKLLWLSR